MSRTPKHVRGQVRRFYRNCRTLNLHVLLLILFHTSSLSEINTQMFHDLRLKRQK